MNGKDFLNTQNLMIDLGKKARALDLDSFIRSITNVQKSIEDIPNNEKFQKANANFTASKNLAESFMRVQECMIVIEDLVSKMGITISREPIPETKQ